MLPSVTEYRDALLFEGALKKYENLVLVKESAEKSIFTCSNFAVVFKMEDKITRKLYALKCFTYDLELRDTSYSLISKHLKSRKNPYFVDFEYVTDEIWVNSQLAGDSEYPVLVMEWIEGQTLGEYIGKLCAEVNKTELLKLACTFDQMALWLLEQPFAHGNLNTENILVEPSGRLRLIDYDGMFTPEMDGQAACENGSPGFRHPRRTTQHFGSFIDDFSILILSLSLHALSVGPSLIKEKSLTDSIFLTEEDLLHPHQTNKWRLMDRFNANKEVEIRLELLYNALDNLQETKVLDLQEILKPSAEQAPKLSYSNFLNLEPYCEKTGCGYKDDNGKIVISCIYDWIDSFSEGMARVRQNGKWGFVDENNNQKIPIRYDYILSFSEGLACVNIKDEWGFIDQVGNLVIPIIYEYINSFSEGLAFVQKNCNEKQFIDRIGNTIIEFEYDGFARSFSEGFAIVDLNGKYGFIDRSGEIAISIIYDGVEQFCDGLAKVKLKDKWGCIDHSGKMVISNKFDALWLLEDGLVMIKIEDNYGLIDRNDKEITPLIYEELSLFSEGLAKLKLNGKCGFIDKIGKKVIPLIYEEAFAFSDGLACVKLNGRYGFIDRNNKNAIHFIYQRASSFHNGLACVCSSRKWGFIDSKGKESIPLKYDAAERFNNGLAMVKLNGKYGYIDTEGKETIPCIYQEACSFDKGLAMVNLNGGCGFINTLGSVIIPLKYDNVLSFYEGFASIKLNGSWGKIDITGKEEWEKDEDEEHWRDRLPNFEINLHSKSSAYSHSELGKMSEKEFDERLEKSFKHLPEFSVREEEDGMSDAEWDDLMSDLGKYDD